MGMKRVLLRREAEVQGLDVKVCLCCKRNDPTGRGNW